MLETAMTSVGLPGREMGQRAADMILEDIEDADDEKPSVQHMVFGTKLIERQRRKRGCEKRIVPPKRKTKSL